MRNSSLLKWVPTAANKNNKLSSNKDKDDKGSKKWIHNPETLKAGHVSYLVKFLGCIEVDKPKGIEVVKQGIQKLKFNQQLKKSEGSKTPKAELTISVEGVAIQEPKTKKILHQYPLHKISYCADDKAEKRFFSFISKDGDGKHTCFVFVSDKLAEEITLTIGQAFELAYKKFLDTSGKELETQKQLLTLQKRIELLENENSQLKTRLRDVSKIKGEHDIQEYLTTNKIKDICEVTASVPEAGKNLERDQNAGKIESSDKDENELIAKTQIISEENDSNQLINFSGNAGLDEKLDGLSLDDLNDEEFDPRAQSEENPGSSMTGQSQIQSFDNNPFTTRTSVISKPSRMDPFELGSPNTKRKSSMAFGIALSSNGNKGAYKNDIFSSNNDLFQKALCEKQPFVISKASRIDPFELGSPNTKRKSSMAYGIATSNNGNKGDAFCSNNNVFQSNICEEQPTKQDPFGMDSFDSVRNPFTLEHSRHDLASQLQFDACSIAADTLSIDDFDPLKDGKFN